MRLNAVKIGTDSAAITRGAESLMTACHSCHNIKYIRYRDLLNIGVAKQKVDEWRATKPVDSPVLALLADENAVQAFGIAPPDLSLMAKARDDGVNYVYSYLLAYHHAADGALKNSIYPETKMPDALGIASATDAAQRAKIEGKSRDITAFLAWAADPHQSERIRLGYYVLAYLVVFTSLLYFVKRKIWARLQ